MGKPKDSLTTDALKKAIARIEGEKNSAECVFCRNTYLAFQSGTFKPACVSR